jgi:hypothetical protein
MVSKALMGVWALLDVCLLAAGVFTIAMSIVWRSPNLMLNMVISDAYLTCKLTFVFFPFNATHFTQQPDWSSV